MKTGTAKCPFPFDILAEWTGLEPATPGVTGRYSNQLNYHSNFFLLLRQLPQPEQVFALGDFCHLRSLVKLGVP